MLALAGSLAVACTEPNYIDAPGDNSHNWPDRDRWQDTAFIDSWDLLTIPAGAISADSACYLCKKMAPGDTTKTEYAVYGYISGLGTNGDNGSSIAFSYGNAYFDIKSHPWSLASLTCYQIMWLDGKKYESLDQVYVGQRVVIKSRLMNFRGTTPETVGKGAAYVMSSSWREKKPETVGDGTLDNPYTVADIQSLSTGMSKPFRREGDTVYVRGYICGAADIHDAEGYWNLETNNFTKNTNVMISDAVGDTIPANLVPIMLQKKSDPRTTVNLVTNPGNLGVRGTFRGVLGKAMGDLGVYGLVTTLDATLEK